MTGDLDVVVRARLQDGATARQVLERLGATRPDGSPLPAALFDGEHHVRARTPFGLLDLIPEGDGPLAFDALLAGAERDEVDGHEVWRVGLAHLALLKRLADRPRDREDLAALEEAYGELPEPPGLPNAD